MDNKDDCNGLLKRTVERKSLPSFDILIISEKFKSAIILCLALASVSCEKKDEQDQKNQDIVVRSIPVEPLKDSPEIKVSIASPSEDYKSFKLNAFLSNFEGDILKHEPILIGIDIKKDGMESIEINFNLADAVENGNDEVTILWMHEGGGLMIRVSPNLGKNTLHGAVIVISQNGKDLYYIRIPTQEEMETLEKSLNNPAWQ